LCVGEGGEGWVFGYSGIQVFRYSGIQVFGVQVLGVLRRCGMEDGTMDMVARRERFVPEEPVDSERLFGRVLPVTRQEAILDALAEKAAAGDVQVAAFLFDRLYGRPGTAPKRDPNAAGDGSKLDLRLLDDDEVSTLCAILQKCNVGGKEMLDR
jgi:hypothetical protein